MEACTQRAGTMIPVNSRVVIICAVDLDVGCRLAAVGCGLLALGCGLMVVGCKLTAVGAELMSVGAGEEAPAWQALDSRTTTRM